MQTTKKVFLVFSVTQLVEQKARLKLELFKQVGKLKRQISEIDSGGKRWL